MGRRAYVTLERLADMPAEELRAEWARRYAEPAPNLPPDQLRLGIGYRLQEQKLGGLRRSTRTLLRRIAARPQDGTPTRRKFYEIAQGDGSPVAIEAVRRIAELYAIEAKVRGNIPAERLVQRRLMARPLVASLRQWLEAQLPRIPQRGKLAEAIRYALARWTGLTRFLDDGRIELDTNPVERAIRPVALGRKNHLFAGSDQGGKRWATVCSLVETAKLNQVEPYAYIADVLQRMVDGHPANRLEELLPWNWKAEISVKQ